MRDRENLRKLIRERGFSVVKDYLLQHARPSIRVYTERVENESSIPLGRSKIGGRPDLPKSVPWTTIINQHKRHFLPFIAQFNLTEVKPFDEENLLPEHGILYFFADPFSTFPHERHFSVLYYHVDLSLLERKELSAETQHEPPPEWEDPYDACTVTFVPEINLPSVDASWTEPDYLEGTRRDAFYDLVDAANYTESPSTHIVNRLLGYNRDSSQDFQLACQSITDQGNIYRTSAEARAAAEERKGDWQLLFQMDSDENPGMIWDEDSGICFYIRRQDLQIKDFSQVCLARSSDVSRF